MSFINKNRQCRIYIKQSMGRSLGTADKSENYIYNVGGISIYIPYTQYHSTHIAQEKCAVTMTRVSRFLFNQKVLNGSKEDFTSKK